MEELSWEFARKLKEVNEDGKRIYVSAYTGKEVDRDYNAALNIKEWVYTQKNMQN